MLAPNFLVHNRYRIIGPIGMGGFGAVYEAVDVRLDRKVALKQLLRPDERLNRQFQREAQLLANLNHPALPRVTDHFVENAGPFLVMDFIAGDDLATLLAQRNAPFSVDQVLDWGDQLLAVLHYLHSRRPPIIHRDIKPQNLKLRDDGAIMLLDFGLAKGMANELAPPTTKSVLAYTKGYAPLEQVRGLGTDARSDLYSLGATLYCLLTATPPVEAELRAYTAGYNIPDELRTTLGRTPGVSGAVAAVLVQALALQSHDRPQSADTMRAQLREARSADRAVPTELATGPVAVVPASGPVAPSVAQPGADTGGQTPNDRPQQVPRLVQAASGSSGTAIPATQRSRPWLWLLGGASIGLLVALLAVLALPMLRANSAGANVAAPPSFAASAAESQPAAADVTPFVEAPASAAASKVAAAADPASSSEPQPAATIEPIASDPPPLVETPAGASASAGAQVVSSANPVIEAQPVAAQPTSEAQDLTALATASATSVLPPENTNCCGFVRYDASNVLDGKPATSWVEGEPGAGNGEALELAFARPITITRIGMNIGFDRDDEIFRANNRLRRVRFDFSDGTSQSAEFADLRGIQYVVLQSEPTSSLRILIEDVYPGSRYDDTPVSEVEVWGRAVP